MAAFARARPCCSGLRASLICCPAWQLVEVAVCQLLIKTIIIFLPTGTSDPGDRKLTKCRSVSGMVTTGTQKQSTSWSDIQH